MQLSSSKSYSGEKLRVCVDHWKWCRCLSPPQKVGFSSTEMAINAPRIRLDGTIEVAFDKCQWVVADHVCHFAMCMNNVIEHTTCPYADSQLRIKPTAIHALQRSYRTEQTDRDAFRVPRGTIAGAGLRQHTVTMSLDLRFVSPIGGGHESAVCCRGYSERSGWGWTADKKLRRK
ncbi:hypothetical protein niasHT_009602 [Heterodera trifolii]|uniref:Uncharacterized protein n=1 Tax=Heterodera trifolii TaxID=157864 RepID=A0ABD2M5A9_9BILA